uniref:Uncharacterized protein n=1 Tax=Cyclopterus lumpus TaxID=8103 RepID=A0A8C2Z1A4_CYCLU
LQSLSAGAQMLQGEVLVGELVAVDGLPTGSVVVGEVTRGSVTWLVALKEKSQNPLQRCGALCSVRQHLVSLVKLQLASYSFVAQLN